MFSEAINLIKNKEYNEAINILQPFSRSEDQKVSAYAYYLIGYINTLWDNPEKHLHLAQRNLLSNICSGYPLPHAYTLYASVADDKNIAVNYLKQGIQRFPDNTELFAQLLRYSSNKDAVVAEILERNFGDKSLLGDVVSYLVHRQEWDSVTSTILRIRSNNMLEVEEDMYLALIEAYSNLFKSTPDYESSCHILSKILAWDINNRFSYAHYLGTIYANIKLGHTSIAIAYFDRIPINNSIYDFNDGPYPLNIYIDFDTVYKTIFDEIKLLFDGDPTRRRKAGVIYSLYLYSPSEAYDIYRYKKADAAILTNYLKVDFNAKVAAALYHMRCHFGQFSAAYEVLWSFLNNYKNAESSDVFLYEILDYASSSDLCEIVACTKNHLNNDDFDTTYFEQTVFPELVKCLHSHKSYDSVRTIAQYVKLSTIIDSGCGFECAFAYGDVNDERAIEIYKGIIQKDASNSAAINNLGVQQEHNGNFYDALICFEKAIALCPDDRTYINNQKRVYDIIQASINERILQTSHAISDSAFSDIGYNVDLCRKVHLIKDEYMRYILSRDLQECAIAVVVGQDKIAAIMCGSIIETLIMNKLTEIGVDKYDLSEISNKSNSKNYPLSNMGLNELLYVAEKEQLIEKNTYRVGHYVRDFRNIVHPAKEMKQKDPISHENVLTMWSVLKLIMNNLFPSP